MENHSIQINEMFANIAHRYDFLNNLLSVGRDKHWRTRAIDKLNIKPDCFYLDVAAGTGDMAIEIAKRGVENVKIKAIDFTEEMLELGQEKINLLNLSDNITIQTADAQALPFKDDEFDGAVCAFGVRNFSNIHIGIREMKRVIKKGSKVIILEFTTPQSPFFRELYLFYFRNILPIIGGYISSSPDAYRYLPDSVMKFPDPEGLKTIMANTGLEDIKYESLSLGIVTIHTGLKP
ncbi:MAG: bifunctional demethylmenaquinone methyltransferase/2-methoxy-6-polyprenyl-1,4-benzoquinol methylase UbiE [Nitrospirae bacterium]|nr:bifunctional demethylmenaquinone methyltransferase/2-methoxy-6-polyprenyl-1,4-benzoquinol methylase UbiE [Nitrospirota bacterium]